MKIIKPILLHVIALIFVINANAQVPIIVQDFDGNTYQVVDLTAGLDTLYFTKTSMIATHYSDGTPIDANYWGRATTPENNLFYKYAYSAFVGMAGLTDGHSDPAKVNTFNDFSNMQGPCPDGWRIPRQSDWEKVLARGVDLQSLNMTDAIDGESASGSFAPPNFNNGDGTWTGWAVADENPNDNMKAIHLEYTPGNAAPNFNNWVSKATNPNNPWGFLSVRCIRTAMPVSYTTSNLPIFVIHTFGQVISNDPKITARMRVVDNGSYMRNSFTGPFNEYDGYIGIEYRGVTSQDFPKKPYGFEIRDSLGERLNISLLGLPAENDWILNSPYSDKTLMRNALMYKLSNDMGHYAPRTRFCELQLNGKYQGIYVLVEKIKIDKNRVNISKLKPEDISGDELTGGYIIQTDRWPSPGEGWRSAFSTLSSNGNSAMMLYQDPDFYALSEVQRNYIKDYVTKFEVSLKSPNFLDADQGYYKYIDMESFVDYFICQELSNNVDAYALSTYFYKDRDSKGGKLTMGPLWDFDFALGNANYLTSQFWDTFAYIHCLIPAPAWWGRFLKDRKYSQLLDQRWRDLRMGILSNDRVISIIDSMALVLQEAEVRNNEKWQVYGRAIGPNYFIGDSFEEEVDYLKYWLTNRMEWLDDNLPVNGPFVLNLDESVANNDFRVYPNPNHGKFTVTQDLQNKVLMDIEIINSNGQVVYIGKFGPGNINLDIDISENQAGLYILKAFANNRVYSTRIIYQ